MWKYSINSFSVDDYFRCENERLDVEEDEEKWERIKTQVNASIFWHRQTFVFFLHPYQSATYFLCTLKFFWAIEGGAAVWIFLWILFASVTGVCQKFNILDFVLCLLCLYQQQLSAGAVCSIAHQSTSPSQGGGEGGERKQALRDLFVEWYHGPLGIHKR